MSKEENITEDEAALYDRQIRLWGLDAQRRLRAAKVLLIGIKGLGAEVGKNIVLSGIKSLTVLDDSDVDDDDQNSQFLVSRDDIGKNRAQSSLEDLKRLNPMVEIIADADPVDKKEDNFFASFDVVCATCCSSETITRINKLCYDRGIQFFAGDVFGYYGYMFSDLGNHHYAEDVVKPKEKLKDVDDETGESSAKKPKLDEPEKCTVKKSMTFSRFRKAMEFNWKSEKGKTKVIKTPKCFFIVRVFLKFLEKERRHPRISNHDEDSSLLKDMRQSIIEDLQVDANYIPEDFASYGFSQLSPVCAIVGGILGQEVIKAVSQKDQPHKNFFFYNGVDGSGLVDNISN